MVIDSHVVFGPFFGPGDTSAQGIGIDAETLLRKMDKNGVDRAVLFPMAEWVYDPAVTPMMVNTALAEVVKAHPDRFYGFLRVNPWHKKALSDARALLENYGFAGMGEFHPISDFFPANSEIMYPFAELAAEFGVPVYMHSGLGPDAAPCLIGDLAERYPQVQYIICHMGNSDWMQAVVVARKLPNVLLEYSSGSQIHPRGARGVLWQVVQKLGAERVIWGSDEPFFDLELSIKEVEICGFTDAQRQLLMGGNLERILRSNR